MRLNMNTSLSLALSFAGPPTPPERKSSKMGTRPGITKSLSIRSKEILYKGISDRPRGWKPRRNSQPGASRAAPESGLKRFDGAARRSTAWDGLRRDPELWFDDGDCLVHLYGLGQSKRGPSFKVSFQALVDAQCEPLLKRFLFTENQAESPCSDTSNSGDSGYFNIPPTNHPYELYIPVPTTHKRSTAMQYHLATRNFFAWVYDRSLAGSQLGASLVQLLNSMSEFRSEAADNVADIIDFMDEEGYADMRNQQDHALAVLFFAEHFHFRDLYVDAFAHCAGMHERLSESPEFQFISMESQVLIKRARVEMDARLSRCGENLGSFLEEELGPARVGISAGTRAHLERFRSFLQAYYVAKIGYYPPSSTERNSRAFPKNILSMMLTDFQKLYEYLVDENFVPGSSLGPGQGGFCILQAVQAFDAKHHYETLENHMPLLPEATAGVPSRRTSKIGWPSKNDKLKPDSRLVAISTLFKATNRQRVDLLDASIVRAYRAFEKECVVSTSKNDKASQVSAIDARKVRWLLIYAMLQKLGSATTVTHEVRDIEDVEYNLCVLTAGCPPWKDEGPFLTLGRAQTDEICQDRGSRLSTTPSLTVSTPFSIELEPDIDYRPSISRTASSSSSMTTDYQSSRPTVRRALSMLGNMPELKHPRPQRNSYHEILVHGYGNGLNKVLIKASPTLVGHSEPQQRELSNDLLSSDASEYEFSSRWSSSESDHGSSPASSISDGLVSHVQEIKGTNLSRTSVRDLLARPAASLARKASSVYSYTSEATSSLNLIPEPLSVRKQHLNDGEMLVTKSVSVEYENLETFCHNSNPELSAYLSS